MILDVAHHQIIMAISIHLCRSHVSGSRARSAKAENVLPITFTLDQRRETKNKFHLS